MSAEAGVLTNSMHKRFAFAVLAISCAAAFGQQAPTYYPDTSYGASDTQTPGSVNCSDPLMAGAVQCSNPNGVSDQSAGRQNRVQAPESYPDQLRGVSRTYSDDESQGKRSALEGRTQKVPLPPEPLTEFQKFIASTTGQILPIYGANLFRMVPSTFAPLDMAPVPLDYIIGPGDELRIKVWGQVNFQSNVRVDRAGEIYIPVPQVGPVHVAGSSYSELDQRLRQAIGRVYRNFDVVADIGSIRSIQVYVAGEARRPGVYTISSLSSLIDAVFASGGPSVEGSLRHIQLRRGSDTIADLDLYAILIHGDKSKDVKLLAGDMIFIPPVGPQVALTGSVRNPAIYELRTNDSLADLIANAGGLPATASQSRVSIERIQDHRERHAMEVAYDQNGLSTILADGDLVRVFSIAPIYTQTVTLRGSIANPGRFAWHPGMRLSELIPDKESLIARDYWWKRVQLGFPAPEFEPTPGFADMRQPAGNEPRSIRSQITSQRDHTPDSEGQPAIQEQDRQEQDRQVQDRQSLSAQQRASSTSLGAQSSTTGFRGKTERAEIVRPGPEIDWAYANILRLDPNTLKTSVIPFDLGGLVMNHESAQDLELQPGDIVSIFSEADIKLPLAQQTKFVKLEGEVVHAGLYSVHPGETLQEVVARAGGLTQNAYLYGADFTRESTRVLQQARIDEYVQSMNLRIQQGSLAAAAAPSGSAQDMATASAAQTSERDLLTRLRQIRASGRIVFEFKPTSTGTKEIPQLSLEDGDRLVVPSVPATVNVVGAVNDQNSFLYSRTGRNLLGTYLKKAGGMTKDADRKRAFVIRASGDVVGYASTGSAWSSDFNKLKLYPGDTIVIPEKTFRPSALRGVLDWSQMFSQFAIGAASISVIR